MWAKSEAEVTEGPWLVVIQCIWRTVREAHVRPHRSFLYIQWRPALSLPTHPSPEPKGRAHCGSFPPSSEEPPSVAWTAVRSSLPASSSGSLVIRVGSCGSWGPLGSCAVEYWQNHPASFRAMAGRVTNHSARRSKLQPYELVRGIPPWELGALSQ